ncbi:MAG: pseudouridine synthase [bacterium]
MSPRIRLHKFLAQAGVTSRRKAETLISEGQVRVNGKVVTIPGTQVDPHRDKVEVRGKRVRAEDLRYLLLHKPVGVVTTLDDPEGRPTILGLLPPDGPRLFPVGRLDFNSEGALLCTNDGELAHALTHPSKRVVKRYLVRVRGHLTEEQLEQLGRGVELEDGLAKADSVLVRAETRSHNWLELTVHEGRNRLIRRMCEALDLPVMRLLRAEFAGLNVDDLRPGTWRELSSKEVSKLRAAAGLERKVIRSGRQSPGTNIRRGSAKRPAKGSAKRPARGSAKRPAKDSDRGSDRDSDRSSERGPDKRSAQGSARSPARDDSPRNRFGAGPRGRRGGTSGRRPKPKR